MMRFFNGISFGPGCLPWLRLADGEFVKPPGPGTRGMAGGDVGAASVPRVSESW